MRASTDPTPVDAALLRAWPLPEPGDSKYSRGDVLVVGGSRGTPGAAMLAGVAALRSGAGRLTLAVDDHVAAAVAVAVPEAAVIAVESRELLAAQLETADAIVVGPGFDDLDQTRDLLTWLLPRVPAPAGVCLDAFALAALHELGGAGEHRFERLVVTPNKEEAALMLDAEEIDDVTRASHEIATRYGATVACYGAVADPEGRLWQEAPGSPGLGTSGSGDVRAGIVAGLLARGAPAEQAAVWGSHLHTRAGERLGARVGRLGFLARELADEIPAVIEEVERVS